MHKGKSDSKPGLLSDHGIVIFYFITLFLAKVRKVVYHKKESKERVVIE